jgi:hypothetical protein
MTFKLISGMPNIDRAIAMLHTKGQKLQAECHVLACSVLAHVAEHGDVRVVAKFLNAMPEAARVNALRAWFEHYGPVAFEKNQPAFVKGKKSYIGDAMAMPFWKFKAEPEYQAVDVVKMLQATVKKLEKDQKETKRDHSAVITGLKAQLAAAAYPATIAAN